MTGSILQLAAIGIDTVYLTGNPTITLFKTVYRRHTNFSLSILNEKVQDLTKFGSLGRFHIPKKGDCVHHMYLRIDIGNFVVKYKEPTNKNILDILNQYGLYWTNSYDENFIITSLIYNTILKPLIYDQIEAYTIKNNIYIDFKTYIKRAINYYHEVNNDLYKQTILKKINNIYNGMSFDDSRNLIYSLLDNLKKYLEIHNYKEIFEYVNNNIITIFTNTNDVINNIYSLLNQFENGVNNISYQNNYIHYLFDSGYGLYVLDKYGDYLRDASGSRVQKKYELDASYNYVLDASGFKIVKDTNIILENGSPIYLTNTNLTTNTNLIARIFDIFKCYYLEVPDLDTITFVEPLFIRDKMYDRYFEYILKDAIKLTPSGYDDLFSSYVRCVFELYMLIDEIRTPSVINYLDRTIGDYYNGQLSKIYNNTIYDYINQFATDASGTLYTRFDSYKIIFKFLKTLLNNTVYNEKSVTDIKTYLLSSIYNNLQFNFIIFDRLIKSIVENYTFNNNMSIDNPHFRIATYELYTNITSYTPDSTVFLTIPLSSFNLKDGITNILNQTSDIVYGTNFYKNDVLSSYNNLYSNLNKYIPYDVFRPYFNDKTLWDFLIIEDTTFKSVLQQIDICGNSAYSLITNDLSANALTNIAIFNYLPLYLIYEIPLAVNYNLSKLVLGTDYLNPNTIIVLDLSSNTLPLKTTLYFEAEF